MSINMYKLSEGLLGRAAARINSFVTANERNRKQMEKVLDENNYWKTVEKDIPSVLTDEQKAEVKRFWSKYSFAYENNIATQEYFTYISGTFNPAYISEGLSIYYLYRFYDSPIYHEAFHNKNYRECLFDAENCTTAVMRRIKNVLYTPQRQYISYSDAIDELHTLLHEHEKLIVKPTPGGGGDGIEFIRRGDTKEQIESVLRSFTEDDLVIEEILKSHPSYAIANPTSLNTLRIITLQYKETLQVISVLFRMGASGKEVDNFTQGGVACGVNPDGTCMDYGFDHFGERYDKHPNGFEFAGHQLYGVDKAIDLVKKLHQRIPQFRQMSWDIAFAEDGTPKLIEMNPRGEAKLYQSAGVLPFAQYTEQVLDELLIFNFYKQRANWKWDYNEYSDHVVLTKYGWDSRKVKVPERINGKYVTQIKAGCFEGKKLKKVIIPGSVVTIDSGACPNDAVIVHLPDERNIVIPTPEGLQAEACSKRNKICWKPVKDASCYLIFRMEAGKQREYVGIVMGSCTEFIDTNVCVGKQYYYYVRAKSTASGLSSGWSKPVAVRTIG